MEPSSAPIPREKLQIWKIFRDVGPEGEEILKLAKLAHVAKEKEAFVVTTADETYSFLRDQDGVCKITKIPELCHVQVKEFVTGSIRLAITEDGRLFSWSNNLTAGAEIGNLMAQLGRDLVSNLATDPNFIGRPLTVKYSRGEKVLQVALTGLKEGRVVALTAGGDVIQWGAHDLKTESHSKFRIPSAKFDCEELISVVCGRDGMTFALSEDGNIFQWKFGTDWIRKSDICSSTPVKKIAGTRTCTFALTAEGTMHVYKAASDGNPVWSALPKLQNNVQDIATSWTGNVLVLDGKNGNRAAWELTTWKKYPSLQSASVDEYFANHCQKSHRTIGMLSPVSTSVQRSTLGQDLWRSKNNVDVTFSVEGKTIAAHKLILNTRSDYFAKMLSNEWMEAGTESAIVIKGTKYITFEALLFYLYHDKVTFAEDEYENIFDLMALADCYCVTNIARDCEKILIRGINAENAFFLVRNASSSNAPILEGKVLKFIIDNRVRLNLNNSSHQELLELIGQDALGKLAVALLHSA